MALISNHGRKGPASKQQTLGRVGGWPANVSINALLSTTQKLSFQWDRGWMPMGLLPGTSGTRGNTQLRPCPSPCADNSPAGEGEQGQDHPGERLQSSEQGHVLKGFLGVSGSPERRYSQDLRAVHPLVWVPGLTLAVHAEGVEQAGATELGTQEGHVQLHQPGLAVLRRQLQLAAAHPPARHGLGIPAAPRLGQEAVHKVELGLLDAVDEGVLCVWQSSER